MTGLKLGGFPNKYKRGTIMKKMSFSPQVNLVLSSSVMKEFHFQEPCKKEGCPNKGVKACPHILTSKGEPIRKCTDFLHYFSMTGFMEHFHTSLSNWNHTNTEMNHFDYLIFFADEEGFHINAPTILRESACLTPILSI